MTILCLRISNFFVGIFGHDISQNLPQEQQKEIRVVPLRKTIVP